MKQVSESAAQRSVLNDMCFILLLAELGALGSAVLCRMLLFPKEEERAGRLAWLYAARRRPVRYLLLALCLLLLLVLSGAVLSVFAPLFRSS